MGFENEEFIFPAIHPSFKFCKLTMTGANSPSHESRIAFYIRRYSQLTEDHRFFGMQASDFRLLNPNTGNCPIFRSQADAELTKAIYRRVPVLWPEATGDQPEVNPWRLKFSQGLFNMASDSHHFRTAAELDKLGYRLQGNVFVSGEDRYLPPYEAKMLHQFDHRFSTYEGATQNQPNVGILPQPTAEQKRDPSFVVQPRYWVREDVVEAAASEGAKWFLGFRRICRTTDVRSGIFSIMPKVAVGDSEFLMVLEGVKPQLHVALIAMLNSFCLDYVVRQKLGGTNLSFFIAKLLPVLSPDALECGDSRPLCISKDRLLELVYTGYDLAALAKDCGYAGPPFPWDESRRFEIRSELDAAFFHLYLPGDADGGWRRAEGGDARTARGPAEALRDAAAFILDQFPIVRQKDEQAHGRYRTRERILEIYDAMLTAQRSGVAYKSTLQPPPGSPWRTRPHAHDTPPGRSAERGRHYVRRPHGVRRAASYGQERRAAVLEAHGGHRACPA